MTNKKRLASYKKINKYIKDRGYPFFYFSLIVSVVFLLRNLFYNSSKPLYKKIFYNRSTNSAAFCAIQ